VVIPANCSSDGYIIPDSQPFNYPEPSSHGKFNSKSKCIIDILCVFKNSLLLHHGTQHHNKTFHLQINTVNGYLPKKIYLMGNS
jgi:hypothetical protein